MTPSRVQTGPGDPGPGDAFEGQRAANNLCGEALLDLLFDRAPAIDHAADAERRG
jgi:hypothetical protein